MKTKRLSAGLLTFLLIVGSNAAYPQAERYRDFLKPGNKGHLKVVESKPGTLTTFLVTRDAGAKVTQLDLTEPVNLIVEFKDEPMFIQQLHSPSRPLQRASYEIRHAQFRADLTSLHQSAVRSLKVQLMNPVVTREFSRVFFGAAVTVPRGMISQIADLSYVKKIHVDKKVKAYLEQSVHQIRADSVWKQFGTQGDGVIVGIIDTGIDYADSALGGGFGPKYKVVGGYDIFNNDSDPMDDNGHGTHVAGIIAADCAGLKGVAPHAKLMAFKVLDQYGSGMESGVIAGVERATDPNNDGNSSDRVDVVNMSLGASGDPDDAVSTAVDNAVKLGITFCVAAGNSGNYFTIGSPGTARLAITVGAVDSTDNVASFSSKGPDGRICSIKPEIVAPGVSILSTYLGNSTMTMSGTSMAAPHVAGVCALLKSLHKNWSPATIKSAVMTSADIVEGEVMVQGSGRVDALGAARTTAFAYPADLNFGLDSSSMMNWTIADTICVKNDYTQNQLFNLSFNDLPAGVSFSSNPSSFALPGGDSLMVVVALTVNNSLVPYPTEGSCAYSGYAYISGSKDTLHLPWAFVKAARAMLTFDQPRPSFMLASTKTSSSDMNATWSDEYNAELIAPRGNYDIVALFTGATAEKFVVKEGVLLESTAHLSINSSDATNLIFFDGVGAQGQLLASLASSTGAFSLGFPDSSFAVSFSLLGITDTLCCSDISSRFTLTAAQYSNDGLNTIYNVQFDPVAGVQGSLSLTNPPGSFYMQNIHANFPPYSGLKREIDGINWTLVSDSSFGMFGFGIGSKIVGDFKGDWSGRIYLTGNKDKRFSYPASFDAIDGPEFSSPDKNIWFEVYPAEIYDNQIGFYFGNEPPDGVYLSPVGGSTSFGHAPFYTDAYQLDNVYGKSNILAVPYFYGAMGEFFYRQLGSSVYTVYDDQNKKVVSDSLINVEPIDVPPGRYRLEVDDNDYYIRNVQGSAVLTTRFDLRRPDADPPELTSMRLLNSRDIPVDSLSKGESGRLTFSAVDIVSSFDEKGELTQKYVSVAEDSTKLFYRMNGSAAWIAAPLTKSSASRSVGTAYYADMSATSMYDSAAVDIKLDVQDESGNSTEWVMMPAFCIGKFGTTTGVADRPGENSIPNEFALYQNYPNPFNPTTAIGYSVPSSTGRDLVSSGVRDGQLSAVSRVSLKVFDVLGREVAVLVNEVQKPGRYEVRFDGSGLASGVYFISIKAGGFAQTRKMLLVK